MRIGLFSDTYVPEVNGVAVSILTLQEELMKHGHEVFIITTHSSLFNKQKDGNILRLPGIELKKLYGYVMSQPLQLFALNDIKEMQLDVIHAHTEFGVGLYARLVAFLLHIPIIATYHTTYEEYTHYLVPFNSQTIDKMAKKTVEKFSKWVSDTCLEIIAPSEKTKELLEKYKIKKPINIIPTGINLQRFKKTPEAQNVATALRKELKLVDKFVLLFVGRIATEKSVDLIIEALPAIKEKIANVHLLVVGDGPQFNDYVNLAKNLKSEADITFVGKVATDAVAKYYHVADVFISASTTETQGLTFIEALSSGLVVFARDRLVVADLLLEAETGYFFDDGPGLLEVLVKYQKKTAADQAKMLNQAVAIAKSYDSEAFYEKVLAVYTRVIHNYRELYNIAEIEAVKECVKLTLKNRVEKMKVLVSVDTYYELGIRKSQVLTNEMVEYLKKEEQLVLAYNRCLNKIRFKDRTTKEIYDFLTANFKMDIKDINTVVEKLIEQSYIDDYRYTKDYIARKSSLLLGDRRIMQNLKSKGINIDTIRDLLAAAEEGEQDIALVYAQKIAPNIKGRSLKEKQLLIRKRMLSRGFSSESINRSLSALNYKSDMRAEMKNLEKAAEKAKQRYQRRYQSTQLRNQVFRYLSNKGYRMEEIYVVLDKMEWNDED